MPGPEEPTPAEPTPPTGQTCPICIRGAPLDVLVELRSSWVTAAAEAPLPGYVCVVSKKHVTEPYELVGADRAAWWDEVSSVAAAVQRATDATKLNYEIHGNTIPHLHLHLYPRYAGDAFEASPIDPHRRPWFERSARDLARLRGAILNPPPHAGDR